MAFLIVCLFAVSETASSKELLGVQYYFDAANAYFNDGKYDDAIRSYSQAISVDPGFAQAYHNRGLSYYRKGQYDDAIADYSKVISDFKPNAGVYQSRGLAYLRKGQYGKSIEDYSKAISLEPGSPDAYHNRGIAYANTGKYDEAIGDYDKVLSIRKDANVYASRGIAFAKKAMADFKKACDMGNKDACSDLKQLSQ